MRVASVAAALVMVLAATACAQTRDTGTLGGLDGFALAHGLQLRVPVERLQELLPKAYALIETSLPKWGYEGLAAGEVAGGIHGDLDLLWQPGGARLTGLPPNAQGDRVYAVVLPLAAFITKGKLVAQVAFMTSAEATAWFTPGKFDPGAVFVGPDLAVYRYAVPDEVARAVIEVLYQPVPSSPAGT
jgi:hypothetical protein